MPAPQEEPQSPPSGPTLPVVALILSVLGLCMPPLLLVSLGLGLYGYSKARRQAEWAPRKQISQLTMAVSGAGLLIFMGLALPNYKLYRLRTEQAQCQQPLLLLHAAQSRLYAKEKRFTTQLRARLAAGSWPAGKTDCPSPADALTSWRGVPRGARALGLHGDCPACSMTSRAWPTRQRPDPGRADCVHGRTHAEPGRKDFSRGSLERGRRHHPVSCSIHVTARSKSWCLSPP